MFCFLIFWTCSVYSFQLQFCFRVSWNLVFSPAYMLFSIPLPGLALRWPALHVFSYVQGSCIARSTALFLIAYYCKVRNCFMTFADAPRKKYGSQVPDFVGSLLFSLYFLLFWAKCHPQSLYTTLTFLSLGSILLWLS